MHFIRDFAALFLIVLWCYSNRVYSEFEGDENQNKEYYKKNYFCPNGWIQQCNKCYLTVDEAKTWFDAEYYCQQNGGHLVSVHSHIQNQHLRRLGKHFLSHNSFWIGANDIVSEGDFKWTDGSPARRYGFRWLESRRNRQKHPEDDCVEMFVRRPHNVWKAVHCTDEIPFICRANACFEGNFRCTNGGCIGKQSLCDGVNDCGDGSDEQGCKGTCNEDLKGMSGNFTSQNYPKLYNNNADCTWKITVPKGFKMELHFYEFEVEKEFDQVEIFDGPSTSSKSIARFDGSRTPKVLQSFGNQLTVQLTSDDSVSKKGFFAHYRAVKDVQVCGGTINLSSSKRSVNITSPGYPSGYPENVKCEWKITAQKKDVITVQVLEFDTEANQDVVEIRNGLKSTDDLLISHSGNTIPKLVYGLNGEVMIKFKANAKMSGNGFRIMVFLGCEATLSGSNFYIESPGFLTSYPNDIDCMWRITETSKRDLTAMFHFFSTEESYDEVRIEKGQGKVVLKQYSGKMNQKKQIPTRLKTGEYDLKMTFTSDYSYTDVGFNCTFSIDCETPKDVPNSRISFIDTGYGGKVVYSCDRGYEMLGEKQLDCNFGGKWSNQYPICQAIDCGHPGGLENGWIVSSTDNFLFDTEITYQCEKNYKLIGNHKRKCLADGSWSDKQPKCKLIMCPSLSAILNGDINVPSGPLPIGTQATYNCNKGYKHVGQKLLICQQDGSWTSKAPTCIRVTCKLPNLIRNGDFNASSSVNFGDSLMVQCRQGYKINGNNPIVCLETGLFDAAAASCVDLNECEETQLCEGPGSRCINSRGSYLCSCEKGWEQLAPGKCTDINECDEKNGGCSQKCMNTNGSFSCSCQFGYHLYNGSDSSVNIIEGQSYIVNATCLGAYCGYPPLKPNTLIQYGGDLRYPGLSKYSCKKGYVLVGPEFIRCSADGIWNTSSIQCDLADCGKPPVEKNSLMRLSGQTFGHIAVYTCAPGYKRLDGNFTRECVADKRNSYWNGKQLSCEPVQCKPLNAPQNGTLKKTAKWNFESMVSFHCDDGYVLFGDKHLQCDADKKWNGTIPTCVAMACSDPGQAKLAIRFGDLNVGSIVRYQCYVDGYLLNGSATRECIYKDNKTMWTNSIPTCHDVQPPKFLTQCPYRKTYILPSRENHMFIEINTPEVVDNSGEHIIAQQLSTNYSSKVNISVGTLSWNYTAVDISGNQAVCEYIINIDDNEKPEIECPPNVEIKSSLPTKVYWSGGRYTDNCDVASVTYSPSNGTLFQSDSTNQVEMIVKDKSGNEAVCVIEVHIEGCGCNNTDCKYQPIDGVSSCSVLPMPNQDPVISCNLACPKGKTFVNQSFVPSDLKCTPTGGWASKMAPPCSDKNPVIGCIKLPTILKLKKENDLPAPVPKEKFQEMLLKTFKAVENRIPSECYNFSMNITDINVVIITKFLELEFDLLLEPNSDILLTDLQTTTDICTASLKTFFGNAISTIPKSLKEIYFNNTFAYKLQDFSTKNATNCCNGTSVCCPSGSFQLVGKSIKESFCVPCGPGTAHNSTLDSCLSCPIGYHQPSFGKDTCIKCPSGTGTTDVQSTSCTALCPAGSFSRDGYGPICRKCHKGTYSGIGSSLCVSCPVNTTTAGRGSTDINDCQAQCQPGTTSQTGLFPCENCTKGTYQDETARAVCKPCKGGGIYGGIDAATSQADCPSTDPCSVDPCQNQAKCISGEFSYTCKCNPGWSGEKCEINIDECSLLPCKNNATCSDGINDRNCTCLQGFTGDSCEININECANQPCLNSAKCIDGINNYSCSCLPGFEGNHCEKNIDECKLLPCLNNSTCIDGVANRQCNCTSGYEGDDCGQEIDECETDPCVNGNCVDKINNYECKCDAGYDGTRCEKDINECIPMPCDNNGTCIDEINGYSCQCLPGYSGNNCSVDINECQPNLCQNSATCVDRVNSFKCHCTRGFTGSLCEININDCSNETCRNNATCTDKIMDYECNCLPGYDGKDCEQNINECLTNKCRNGTCVDLIADYECDCVTGFTGEYCDIDINECESISCENGGTCIDGINSFQCFCQSGFNGTFCENNIDDCQSQPCSAQSFNCTDLIDDFLCVCNIGYKGKLCDVEIDYCLPNPCQYNSSCVNIPTNATYQCNCSAGYQGRNCEKEINECATDPCKNNAQCIDRVASFECACPVGYSGLLCENNIDDCPLSACLNGGTCIDGVNIYTCKCPWAFKGPHCEKERSTKFEAIFPSGEESFVQYNNLTTSSSITVAVWLRYTPQTTGTAVTIVDMQSSKIVIKRIEINERYINVNAEGISYPLPFNSLINDGLWHHVAITIDGTTGQLTQYQDGREILEFPFQSLSQTVFFPNGGHIYLGQSINVSTLQFIDGKDFSGKASQFGIWNRVLNRDQISALLVNCSTNLTDAAVSWLTLTSKSGANVTFKEQTNCGTNVCDPGFTGQFCETRIDKTPPTVVSCPTDMLKVVQDSRIGSAKWVEPVFSDNIGIVQITSSHAPGQKFTWGDYVVTYIARDKAGNAAQCTFDLFVTRYDCPILSAPLKGSKLCGSWELGRFCDITCFAKHEFALLPKPFYACGVTGQWNHGPPNYPDNPSNLFPACSRKEAASLGGNNEIEYEVPSCDDAFIKEFRAKFIKKITGIQTYWKICGAKCNFDNIGLKCDQPTRKRRDGTVGQARIIVELPIAFDGSSMDTYTEKVAEGIKTNQFYLNLTVNGQLVNYTSGGTNPKVILTCPSGFILVNKDCVICPSGTYHNNATSECTECPVNTYQDQEGLFSCNQCPDNKTTNGIGTNSSSACEVTCSEGTFFNKTKAQCQSCPIGYYQDTKGSFQCKPCPVGKSTTKTSAISLQQCTNICPLGYEVDQSESCSACQIGTYRDQVNQTECLPCPFGYTTPQTATKDRKLCQINCPAGFEATSDEKQCKPCYVGFYRENTSTKQCQKCPNGTTTKTYEAQLASECKEIPSSKMTGIEIRFLSMEWTEDMKSFSSYNARITSTMASSAILQLYNPSEILTLAVTQLRKGSVIANIDIQFNQSMVDPLGPLRVAVGNGQIGGFLVNSTELTIDHCRDVKCPINSVCVQNTTLHRCECNPGSYLAGTVCLNSCSATYCLNNGVCSESSVGRKCRCPADISGERCETKDGNRDLIIIVLAVSFAVFVIVLIIVCIYNSNLRQHDGSKKMLSDNDSYEFKDPFTEMNNTEPKSQQVFAVSSNQVDNQTAQHEPLSFSNTVAIDSVKADEVETTYGSVTAEMSFGEETNDSQL